MLVSFKVVNCSLWMSVWVSCFGSIKYMYTSENVGELSKTFLLKTTRKEKPIVCSYFAPCLCFCINIRVDVARCGEQLSKDMLTSVAFC